MNEIKLQLIYVNKVNETLERLNACDIFLKEIYVTENIYYLESSILQLRKALECLAFASIAPNKIAYEKFRSLSDEKSDFRKDFHAKKIFQMLSKINKDFYPFPVLPAVKQKSGEWHFERKSDGFLTKKEFESLYDRLGKYLHADNPWGNEKSYKVFIKEMPQFIDRVYALLNLHVVAIRTSDFNGIWVIESNRKTCKSKIITGKAQGEFIIQY